MKRYFLLIFLFVFLFSCKENKVHKSILSSKVFSHLKTERARYTQVKDEFKAQGSVISKDAAKISAKVMGEVEKILVKEGDMVKKGDLIIKIQDNVYMAKLKQAKWAKKALEKQLFYAKNQLNEARSQFLLAKKTFYRFRSLKEKGVVSKQKFDEVLNEFNRARSGFLAAKSKVEEVKSRLKVAKARIKEAKAYLAYTEVVAPFNGRVIEKFVDTGDTVVLGTPLVAIQKGNKYQIKCIVPESYINFIKIGNRFKSCLMGKEIIATVSSIVYQGDPMSRSYIVKLDITNNNFIKPGMYATVYIPGPIKKCLCIPKSAIITYGQIQGIFVVDHRGIVTFRVIRTGRRLNDRLEVISGLRSGERFVVSPPSNLKDGDRITQGA